MNLVGEWRKPAEGAKLSGAVKSGTIRGRNSGESRKREAALPFSCKGAEGARKRMRFLISQAKGQRQKQDLPAIFAM